jgi:hypothetical protein
MKKVITLFSIAVFGVVFIQRAQAAVTLPFYDSIPSTYSEGGQLGAAGVGDANWTAGGTPGVELTVAAANALSYSGLQAPPAGSRGILYTMEALARNRGVNFTAVSSGKVYCSFLMKVTGSTIASGNRVIGSLHSSTTASSTPECAIILSKISGNNGTIGLGKHASSYLGTTSTGLSTNTHLVVVRYTFVDGDNNNTMDLWLDPGSLGATEGSVPAATLADLQDAGQPDAASLNTFFLQVGSTAANGISFDEIRIGTNWADVTPPTTCITAGISSGPNDKTGYLDTTATFNISATGLNPTFNWQFSTDDGTFYSDTGAESSTNYTTPTLNGSENGYKYRCIVTTPCDSLSVTSSPATLTVVDGGTISFRTVTNGNWNSPATWEQSPNGVNSWTPASGSPTSANSNITVRTGHTVTVGVPVTVDQLVVQAGGEVDVNGTAFEINSGGGSPDASISGTLKLTATAGSTVSANGALQFENGGKFTSALTNTAIPSATWATNSTCEIAPASPGAAAPTGLGQTFGNFTWYWPNMSGSVVVGALTTINGNLTVTTTNSAANGGLKLNNGGSQTLTVGGNVHVAGGYLCLMGSSSFGSETMNIGGDLIIDSGAFFDGRNSAGSTINIVFTDPNGPRTHVLNNAGTISHSSGAAGKNIFAWQITSPDTLLLNSDFLDVGPAANGQSSLVVDGTLNCNGHVLGGAGFDSLTVNGILLGNGINPVATVLNDVTVNGTLNINQSLPTFTGGESLPVFSSVNSIYNLGSMTIIPATPPGADSWDTTTTPGTLIVVGGSGPTPGLPRITSIVKSGSSVIIGGTNGTHSGTYHVLSSGNVATAQPWPSIQTNGFDAGGNFSFTNAIGSSPLFFIIQQQP